MGFQIFTLYFQAYGTHFCLTLFMVYCHTRKCLLRNVDERASGGMVDKWVSFCVESGGESLNTTKLTFISIPAMIY